MKRNPDGTYVQGHIYELRVNVDSDWLPFYVGETVDLQQRIIQHRGRAQNATDSSTLVYRFIKEHLQGYDWDIFEIDRYGAEGPEALEDEHIMRLLVDGVSLKNTKKGNANWMQERMQVADDMRRRNITSYKKYREVLSYEEHERKINEANARRVAEELERQAELTRQEQIRQQHLEHAQQLAEAARIKAERELAARQAREEQRRRAWLADAPAREERLRKEAEELQRKEQEDMVRQQALEELRQQRLRYVDEAIARHDAKIQIIKQQQHEELLATQARLRKILEKK